jgi:hypothetical protein
MTRVFRRGNTGIEPDRHPERGKLADDRVLADNVTLMGAVGLIGAVRVCRCHAKLIENRIEIGGV